MEAYANLKIKESIEITAYLFNNFNMRLVIGKCINEHFFFLKVELNLLEQLQHIIYLYVQ